MWEDKAVSVEILDIVRRWMNRPRDGRIEVRILGRSVLMIEWGGRPDEPAQNISLDPRVMKWCDEVEVE